MNFLVHVLAGSQNVFCLLGTYDTRVKWLAKVELRTDLFAFDVIVGAKNCLFCRNIPTKVSRSCNNFSAKTSEKKKLSAVHPRPEQYKWEVFYMATLKPWPISEWPWWPQKSSKFDQNVVFTSAQVQIFIPHFPVCLEYLERAPIAKHDQLFINENIYAWFTHCSTTRGKLIMHITNSCKFIQTLVQCLQKAAAHGLR